jgi:hypothetical protein
MHECEYLMDPFLAIANELATNGLCFTKGHDLQQ